MNAVLLLDIGNTSTSLGVSGEDTFSIITEGWTSDFIQDPVAFFAKTEYPKAAIVASCVVPDARDTLHQRYGGQVKFISTDMVPDVDFSGVDMETLGEDRIANTAAAVALYERPVMVVDCGTAITTEVIDERKKFRGGIITPGRILQRQSLQQKTGQLPFALCEHAFDEAFGLCTSDAIAAGVDEGLRAAVSHYIRLTRENLNSSCRVVATGRDASFFCECISELELGPPAFTLYGLSVAARIAFNDQNCGDGESC